MPITKKKGAIFAIHADTPDKVFNTGPSSAFGAPSNATSPIRKDTAVVKRKALGVKQAYQPRAITTQLQAPTTTSEKDDAKIALSEDAAKLRTVLRPKTDNEKRHRMPSADLPRSFTSTSTSTVVTTSVQTPAKKARVVDQLKVDITTPSGRSTEDRGSPASRTRSKTKSRVAPSPRQRIPIVTSLISIDDANTVKQKPVTTRRSAMSIFVDAQENSENIPPAPVPVKKQVLDRRRGNAVIDLLSMAGENGPEEEDMEEFERAYDENMKVHRMTKEARAAVADDSFLMPKLKGKGKGRTVKADGIQVLGDVSEAYGASGSEPTGFKEQKACKR